MILGKSVTKLSPFTRTMAPTCHPRTHLLCDFRDKASGNIGVNT